MYAILADVHGNMPALKSVVEDMRKYDPEGIILLGDLIDYGMQSNEVVQYLEENWKERIICNIRGNHEQAILTSDYDRFSSPRGAACARYTASQLSASCRDFLDRELNPAGKQEFELCGRRILAVHGSLEDPFWKAIGPENVRGEYGRFDIVLSGHSHVSHLFSRFYEADDPERRNRHAVLFINPGSVGQPRNHNPAAQYALLDMRTLAVSMRAVAYDVKAAMALYDGSVDDFYRARLEFGV